MDGCLFSKSNRVFGCKLFCLAFPPPQVRMHVNAVSKATSLSPRKKLKSVHATGKINSKVCMRMNAITSSQSRKYLLISIPSRRVFSSAMQIWSFNISQMLLSATASGKSEFSPNRSQLSVLFIRNKIKKIQIRAVVQKKISYDYKSLFGSVLVLKTHFIYMERECRYFICNFW